MRLLPALTLLSSLAVAFPALSAERTMIVLDASGSMWGQIDGKAKMEIARETLGGVLQSVPKETELGLMVYGHRDKGSCSDIELVVPAATGTGDAIAKVANGINPKGKTPISDAVRQAAESLRYTEDKATVVLVTDGLETCQADPCAIASELEKSGVDFTAHVVGFGLTEEEGRQVACLAENTGGKYFQASDAGQLVSALTATVAEAPMTKEPVEEVAEAAPEPVIKFNVVSDATLSEGGPSLADDSRVRWDFYKADTAGNRSEEQVDGGYDATYETNLPAGKYFGEARMGALKREVAFEVKDGEIARPTVNFDAGILTVTPKRTAEDEAFEDSARIDVRQGEFADGGYGKVTMVVPQGDLDIEGSIGPTSATGSVSIKAGETIEHDLVIGSGIVVAKAVYADGGPDVEESGIRFDIVAAKAGVDGERKNVQGGYGVDSQLETPAGDFVLVGKLGSAEGETAFSVKAGERAEVVVNINAGVLAISAPGAYRIDIKEAKKDIQGNQKDVAGTYGEAFQETLHPGTYIVAVSYEGDRAPQEKEAVVAAGERAEVTVE